MAEKVGAAAVRRLRGTWEDAETYAVASAASRVRSSRSASSSPTTSGGLILSTLSARAVGGEQHAGARFEHLLDHRRGALGVGQLDAEEQALAADVGDRVVALAEPAQAGLDPVAEPRGVRPAGARRRSRRAPPAPAAHETGLPPKVLKYSIPVSNERAIAGVVTTAPIGWPLPIGLPSVTMSGTTPCELEAPERVAHATEADLDLVGDADRAGGARAPRTRHAR